MHVGKLKKEKPYASKLDRSLGIQTYGEGNSFPQQVLNIVLGSSTGSSCIDVYSKFIKGRGFKDPALYNTMVSNELTADDLSSLLADDKAMFNGYAIHINWNANFRIIELQWTPLETVRFCVPDEKGKITKVALHWDWAKQFQQIRKWSADDIDYIDLFNPDPKVIQMQVDAAGGWDKYKGQVLVVLKPKFGVYALPIYFATLTDMSTEQGLTNVSYRNVRNNFLPSGVFFDIINDAQSDDQENDTENAIIDFQGDEEACKIMYMRVNSKEEIPTFTEFPKTNLDKEFTYTDDSTRGRIGRSFNQPPILRAENVGAGFGADLIENAYQYYNAVTDPERLEMERVFSLLFKYWHEGEFTDFSIMRLTYVDKVTLFEKLGKEAMAEVTAILTNTGLSTSAKKHLLTLGYGLSVEEADLLMQKDEPLTPLANDNISK